MRKFSDQEIMNILNKKTISEEEKAGLKVTHYFPLLSVFQKTKDLSIPSLFNVVYSSPK